MVFWPYGNVISDTGNLERVSLVICPYGWAIRDALYLTPWKFTDRCKLISAVLWCHHYIYILLLHVCITLLQSAPGIRNLHEVYYWQMKATELTYLIVPPKPLDIKTDCLSEAQIILRSKKRLWSYLWAACANFSFIYTPVNGPGPPAMCAYLCCINLKN